MKDGEICSRSGTNTCSEHNLHCGYPRCIVKKEEPRFKPGDRLFTNEAEVVVFEFEAPSHPRIEGPVAIVHKTDGSFEQFTIAMSVVKPLTYHLAISLALNRYGLMMHQKIGVLPEREFTDFVEQATKAAADESFPLPKLCRWLGYIQGVLIERNYTSVSIERDWTRPLFRHFDYPDER